MGPSNMYAQELASAIVVAAEVYVAAGVLFAIAFLRRGIEQIDPAAKDSTRGFRWIILPGVVAFWPLLLRRWIAGHAAPPIERNAHRRAAEARR